MKRFANRLAIAMLFVFSTLAFAAKVGETAPDFTVMDTNGKMHKLSDYRGKFVVLEWHNQGCPYVKKHYNSGNMQKLQKDWTSKGVVWLTIISSAPGKQGYVSGAEQNDYMKKMNVASSAALLDPSGDVGKLYSAKTTPHMYVVDAKGTLVYNGAIDDKSGAAPSELEGATNYVSAALNEATAGKPVTTSTTRPYGCTVKYAD